MTKPAIDDTRFGETAGGVLSGTLSVPASGRKDTGYVNGDVPPPGEHSWIWNKAHQWFKLIDSWLDGATPPNVALPGTLTCAGTLACAGLIAPIVIASTINPPLMPTGTTDDWTVSGAFAGAGIIELQISGTPVISGLLAGVNGRIIWLFVYSNAANSDTVTLKHEDTGSVPANRFQLPNVANLVIPQYGLVQLRYSTSRSRWTCAAKNF